MFYLRTRFAAASLLLLPSALLAQDGLSQSEIRRADAPGSTTHEVIVSRLEIAPGATVPLHSHHGDEHMVVLEGGTMRTGGGKELAFPAGATAHFPAGKVHGGLTNAGDTPMVAITTHIVEKGKPLNIPVQ
jgi:quercetin dioxygenase-like cupin family protein